jgi:catechol 2,3-dioxygenase-like lactoylglutathione lyase family enzyme
MFADGKVIAVIAAKDLKKAEDFYSKKLGLKKVKGSDPGGLTFKSGGGTLYVYESKDNAGTNKATSAHWEVKDVEAVVDELKGKGVKFEHYNMPGIERKGDIHIWDGKYKAAWFKDPSGNILAVGSM